MNHYGRGRGRGGGRGGRARSTPTRSEFGITYASSYHSSATVVCHSATRQVRRHSTQSQRRHVSARATTKQSFSPVGYSAKSQPAYVAPRVFGTDEKFRQISVCPQRNDILRMDNPDIEANLVSSPYRDRNHYLDVQFRLLREDLIRPIRDAVRDYTYKVLGVQAETTNAKVYRGVRITFATPCFAGMRHKIYLNRDQAEKIPWKTTKQLLGGNLVCLSSDNFQSCLLFGTVARGDPEDLDEGQLFVQFEKSDKSAGIQSSNNDSRFSYNVDIDFTKVYTMIESEAYFEAYKHVLGGLQEIERIPLEEHIVACRKEVLEPAYLKAIPYDFSSVVKSRVRTTSTAWPDAKQFGLNEYQYQALKQALTKKLAIIQGPPGTGKTHVGLKIAKVLLSNKSSAPGPILVVCYTNHALDQFLEGISKFNPKGIIRVGGRCKNKNLEKYMLKNVSKRKKNRDMSRLWARLCQLEEAIEKQQKPLDRSRNFIFPLSVLESVMRRTSPRARFPRSTKPGEEMMSWLGLDSEEEHPESAFSRGMHIVDDTADDFEVMEEALIAQERREVETWQSERRKKPFTDSKDPYFNANGWKTNKKKKKIISRKIEEEMNKENAMSAQEAIRVTNVYTLAPHDRWRLYKFWVARCCAASQSAIKEVTEDYFKIVEQVKELQDEEMLKTCSEADVVGLTTTGAAKFRKVIQRLPVQIVIVEEAAEVLEAHIVTSMPKSTERLILIGDHQQLRPSPTVHELAVDYKLDVSMFQRLVDLGLPYVTLRIQHRMRPEIANLLRLDIYKQLEDHRSVQEYENIRGVKTNVFFLSHDNPEDTTPGKSKANKHEASFFAALCKYLLNQGYSPQQITILTAYSGQLVAFKKCMQRNVHQGVRVTTVDNFQGEESDIILLSLVRSNEQGKIGFLSIANRVCVALSRAKKGLFCMGDFEMLHRRSKLWKNIVNHLEGRKLTGRTLCLRCENHPERCVEVATSEDFAQVPEGGCSKMCEILLSCGHTCTRRCHPTDKEHKDFVCKKRVEKHCATGDAKHIVRKICHQEKWPVCRVLVTKTIPKCGHSDEIPCYMNPEDYKCQAACAKFLECGHQCANRCADDCTESSECDKLESVRLVCGHRASVPCCKVQLLKQGHRAKCNKLVEKTIPKCGHSTQMRCYMNPEDYNKCQAACAKFLECGHQCANHCSDVCTKSSECVQLKSVRLVCGHRAPVPCYTAQLLKQGHRAKCNILVEKTIPKCGHSTQMRCHMNPNDYKCQVACAKFLYCGHQCANHCSDVCTESSECDQLTSVMLRCGHPKLVRCKKALSRKLRDCSDCSATLKKSSNDGRVTSSTNVARLAIKFGKLST